MALDHRLMAPAGPPAAGPLPSARHSQALAEVAREVAGVAVPAEWGARAVSAVESVTGWARVLVFRLNERAHVLELLASRGAAPQQAQQAAVLRQDGPSLSALAVKRGGPLVSGLAEIPSEAEESARQQSIAAFVVLPLIAHGRVLGTLTLLDPAPREVAGEELAFLQAVADLLATGLSNAQLLEAAQSAQFRLSTIFNQMGDGVLVLDPQGRVVESNAAASRLVGGPLDPGMTAERRRHALNLRRPDGTPLPAEERPSAIVFATGSPVNNIQMVAVHKDGTQVELSASCSPLHDQAGRLLGAVTVLRDVTELRRLERAKDNFLSVASHELRTPLTPLKGLTQILLRNLDRAAHGGTLDVARVARYLRTMDGQVDRLAGLVNDLLDVSRIRAGRMQLRPEPVDLVALTRGVLERFVALAPVEVVGLADGRDGGETDGRRASDASDTSAPGLVERITAAVGGGEVLGPGEAAEDGPPRLIRFEPRVETLTGFWDPPRLEQVITNLVANSIKYSPAGGEIVVRLERRDTPTGTEAHLAVSDPGIGLPPEQIADLFQPFARLANAPAESFGGLGLGLYISHDIVQRHGGRLWAESPGPGQGATFHVTLPLN